MKNFPENKHARGPQNEPEESRHHPPRPRRLRGMNRPQPECAGCGLPMEQIYHAKIMMCSRCEQDIYDEKKFVSENHDHDDYTLRGEDHGLFD